MGTTLSEVIDRVYRDWLWPPNEQPTYGRLASSIDNSQTTLAYSDGYFSVEELAAIRGGSLIEVDRELLRVQRIDENSFEFTVDTRGGIYDTDAATHTAGAKIILDPNPPRQAVFEVLCDAIEDLNDDLFPVATIEKTSDLAYIEVPAACVKPLHYRYRTSEVGSSDLRYTEGRFEYMEDFTPSSTTKAIQLHGVPEGRTGYLTYAYNFERPTVETYDFEAKGFETEWIRFAVLGAVIQLAMRWDLPTRTQEFITEGLAMQGFPVGSGESIDRALIRVYEYGLQRAKKRLNRRWPMRVEMNKVSGS